MFLTFAANDIYFITFVGFHVLVHVLIPEVLGNEGPNHLFMTARKYKLIKGRFSLLRFRFRWYGLRVCRTSRDF